MKKQRIFAYVLTLFMCTSLSSCLSTDDTDSGYDGVLPVYVSNNYLGRLCFSDAAGNTLMPTSESLAYFSQNGYDLSDYDMLIIYFNFVDSSDVQGNTSTTPQTYDIELVAFQPMEVPETIGVQTVEDMEEAAPETAPMLALKLTSSWGSAIVPYMFDDRTAIAYTGFWLTNDQEMLEKHSVKLVYVQDEIKSSSEDLVVYLRHDKGEDDGVAVYYSNYYGLNLQSALSNFRSVNGHDPDKIIIKVKECTNSTSSLPTEYTSYEIEYKSSTTE